MRAGPNDPNIHELASPTAIFREREAAAHAARTKLDWQIQAMKANGYSFPALAKVTGVAIATIQYAVAKEAQP